MDQFVGYVIWVPTDCFKELTDQGGMFIIEGSDGERFTCVMHVLTEASLPMFYSEGFIDVFIGYQHAYAPGFADHVLTETELESVLPGIRSTLMDLELWVLDSDDIGKLDETHNLNIFNSNIFI